MLKRIFGLLIFVTSVASSTVVAVAQCTDILLPARSSDRVIEKATATKNTEIEKNYTHVLAELDQDVRFKIQLEQNMDGGFSKDNDFVKFSVLENVYGRGRVPNGAGFIEKRCVIIPKGMEVYGTVDHANSRYPFYIGGKGKLYVTVSRLTLDNGVDNTGVEILLNLVNPIEPRSGFPPPKKRDRTPVQTLQQATVYRRSAREAKGLYTGYWCRRCGRTAAIGKQQLRGAE